MASVAERAQSGLAAIVGEEHVAADDASRRKFAVDGVRPEIAVYPSSAEEVADVLRRASEQDLAVIPCRNTTRLEIGNIPRRYDVALCLKRMNSVWYYEPADLVISVEAGMKFGEFQHFVTRDGLWLPLDPPGGDSASIGGILATNSAGPLRLLYGAPRDMVLGMKIATAEGKLIKTGGRVVKNVAGYDLGKLLIGSYGTLGVIVEATLKLFPRPRARRTFMLSPGTLEAARDLHKRILESPLQPMRMVLLDAEAGNLLGAGPAVASRASGLKLWVEAGGSERVLARAQSDFQTMADAAGCDLGTLEARAADAAWGKIADFGNVAVQNDPQAAVLKAALPIAAAEEFLDRANQIAEGGRTRMAGLAQLGVGIVHIGLFADQRGETLEGIVQRLREAAAELGGTLVIEHAPAELKKRVDVWGPAGDDFALMKRVKDAWDPKGIFAPGRFLGGL